MTVLKNLASSFFLYTFLALVLPAPAGAQTPTFYSEIRPTVSCTRAMVHSSITVSLRGCPPRAKVLWSFGLGDENGEVPFRATYHDQWSLDLGPNFEGAVADSQGRLVLPPIPLDKWENIGRRLVLKMLVQNGDGTEDRIGIKYPVSVENPGLYLASALSDSEGLISRFDEMDGRISAEIGFVNGRPGKVVFNRNASRGYILLDQDRIAVFDNTAGRVIREQQTGIGLVDIAVTPDGRKLIALTRGRSGTDEPALPRGQLWIYDIEHEDLAFLNNCIIDPVTSEGDGRYLGFSDDATLVFVRQGDLTVGEYDLLTGAYRLLQVGTIDHLGGRVQDILVSGNCLLALLVHPAATSCLSVVNLQTYLERRIAVGMDVRGIHLIHSKEGRPLVVLHDRADAGEDVLYQVDFLEGEVLDKVSIPDGVAYLDVSSPYHLCMLLYQDLRTGESVLAFFDLENFVFHEKRLSVPVTGEARVYLSRSPCSESGYVYSRNGMLIQIGLSEDRFGILRQISVKGLLTGRAGEIY